ncbi:hypothetical protein [Spirosoma terrae]|uniref:Uncharacterized protein n=1 Tax=Spirosoma terrae TaxID=1968276 RepID=A0A6L9LH15_9BACT|nr:hypothetical protein [Spirosoma terrae]NDU97888.1 hypothetical protein [Spirosoma terrae]
MNNTNVAHWGGCFQLISTDAVRLSTNEKAGLSNEFWQLVRSDQLIPVYYSLCQFLWPKQAENTKAISPRYGFYSIND